MTLRVLPRPEWEALAAAHEARVDVATAAHRERRADGRTHPVEDFLFRYYNNSPARLRRWHPGAGVLLEDAAHRPRAALDPLPRRRVTPSCSTSRPSSRPAARR